MSRTNTLNEGVNKTHGMEPTPAPKDLAATVGVITLRLETKAASVPSSVLRFVPDAVVRRAAGLKPRFNQRPRRCRQPVREPEPIVCLPEDPLSKPNAWYDEALDIPEERGMTEEEFVMTLTEDEWEHLQVKRIDHFNDHYDWCLWRRRMLAVRSGKIPAKLTWKVLPARGTPMSELMRLREDYLEEPSKYFNSQVEQKLALREIEARIIASEILPEELALERAARTIQKNWKAYQAQLAHDLEMEEFIDRFERMWLEWD